MRRNSSKPLIVNYKDKEVELNATILNAINDNPENYSILLEAGTADREEYLKSLENLFNSYEDSTYTGANRVFAIVKNMQNWMRSLPDYTKKFSYYYHNGAPVKVDNSIKIVRNDLLKFEINARETLFSSWKDKLSANGEYLECAAEIRRVKEFLDMHIVDFKESLIDYLVALFMPGYTGTLSKAVKLWYEKLPESTKRHVFDTDANALLLLANNWNSYDDQRLLNELSILIVSMGIEDWTDQLFDNFKQSLEATLDEFSKFLEANLDSSKMLNFKIIQDMAEAATRSGKKQIHFTCITHKDILDYSSSDSFKTVEGRFNKIHYVATSEQSYELISNAIPKKASFEAFVNQNANAFVNALRVASIVNVFEELESENFERKVLKGCFPLAPLSAFALLHVSELVGQNERTLFTFLAKKDAYSLPEFLSQDFSEPVFVTVDNVYDYFQDLLKKEIFNATIHSIWAKTDTALRQVKDNNQKKILKAIALIYMIDN